MLHVSLNKRSETKDGEHRFSCMLAFNSNILVCCHEYLNCSNDGGTRIGIIQMMAVPGV
jgi:hypothetical protein